MALKQTEIYQDILCKQYLKDIAKKCLSIWIGKYIKKTKELKKVQERLEMSALEIIPFEEAIKNARIVGELERAEQKGEEKGIKIGEQKGIKIGKEKGIKIGEEKEKQKWMKEIQQQEEIIKEITKNLSPEELSKLNIPQKEIEKYLK